MIVATKATQAGRQAGRGTPELLSAPTQGSRRERARGARRSGMAPDRPVNDHEPSLSKDCAIQLRSSFPRVRCRVTLCSPCLRSYRAATSTEDTSKGNSRFPVFARMTKQTQPRDSLVLAHGLFIITKIVKLAHSLLIETYLLMRACLLTRKNVILVCKVACFICYFREFHAFGGMSSLATRVSLV